MIENIEGQEQVEIPNAAEVLGNPHGRFPADPNFVACGIVRAFRTISPEKAQLYQQLLAAPEQQREIDPPLWTAACAIVHCLCCWHFARGLTRQNLRCPNFLAPYLEQQVNGAESLRNLERSFNHFANQNERGRLAGYNAQARVMMKIREPYVNWRLGPLERGLVNDILKLAHVVSQTPHFRNDLYPQAIALHPNQEITFL